MFKIAIVGAGPSGIAMAAELTASGISADKILMLEKANHNNASIRQFYPKGKEINSVYKNIQIQQESCIGFSGIISLDTYFDLTDKALKESSVSIIFDAEVQKIIKQPECFVLESTKGSFQAEQVVLAGGVFTKARRPDYTLGTFTVGKVHFDLLQFQKEKISNCDVLVIGGGDTASEYVQTIVNLENRVSLSYRQDNFFRMNQRNKDILTELEISKKINIYLSTNVLSVSENGNKLIVNFEEIPALTVDHIVYALGGASPSAFLASCGIVYDENNVQLKEYNESFVDGMFLAGDLICGRKGGSLMFAFNSARTIMKGLHKKYNYPQPK